MSSIASPSRSFRRTLSRRVFGSSLAGALTTPHGVDRYLELVHPSFSLDEVRGEVVDVRRPTPETVTIGMRPNGNWHGFRAGQYVRVAVEIDGVRRTRCYSMAGSQHASLDRVEISVKATRDGLVSRSLYDRAAPGMVIGLSPADGAFVLPEAGAPDRLLLISGGSGITPVMSLLRTLVDQGHDRPVTFLHYCRGEDDLVYAEELARIAAARPNVSVAVAHTGKGGATGRDAPARALTTLRGRFTLRHVLAVEPNLHAAETYVCGPAGMIDTVSERWAALGLEQRLHVERFTAPLPVVSASDAAGAVTFSRSGETVAGDSRSLLEQAEAAGLAPEFGCRMGICHSCTARKQSGCVRNVRSGELSGPDEEDVQICVSAPVGDVTLDL